jgi:hypothetical protein
MLNPVTARVGHFSKASIAVYAHASLTGPLFAYVCGTICSNCRQRCQYLDVSRVNI